MIIWLIECGGREKIGEGDSNNDSWGYGLAFWMGDELTGWDAEYSRRRSRFGVKNNRVSSAPLGFRCSWDIWYLVNRVQMVFEAMSFNAISLEERHSMKIQRAKKETMMERLERWDKSWGRKRTELMKICTSKRLNEVKTVKSDWIYWN